MKKSICAMAFAVAVTLPGCAVLTAQPTLHAYLLAHAAGVADVITVGTVVSVYEGAIVNGIALKKDISPASGVK